MVSVASRLAPIEHPSDKLAFALLSAEDKARVEQAFGFAHLRAGDRLLDTEEPALLHLAGVVQILTELRADADTRIAGLLSALCFFEPDLEADVEKTFGRSISRMLSSLRQLYRLRAITLAGSSPQQAIASTARWSNQIETLRKMLLAMASDVRVVLVRLCSRLQTLRFFSTHDGIKLGHSPALSELSKLHARETLDLYAPLANRLGLWQIKWEMEDLAFRLLDGPTYKQIAGLLDEKRIEREAFIERCIGTLRERLGLLDITAEITGRPKHIFSIWNKMREKHLSFDQLYDVRACRIIVDDVKSCYTVLGIVHELWQPIAREFDDYIAKPKANGYQSLHTVVTDQEGKTLEVQIRTHDMHKFAEYGVAAHWRYKEAGKAAQDGNSRAEGGFEDRIAWLRQLLAWKADVTGNIAEPQLGPGAGHEPPDADKVYVFTPQGRVLELPPGSTALDFAYRLHTELGHKCRGAKVDGALVPLNKPLQNGQTVDIITARDNDAAGPSRDWLNPQLAYLVSHRAKQKVRQWFAQQELKETLDRGRQLVERELQRIGQTVLGHDGLAARLGYAQAQDLYGALAREEIRPRAIEHALQPPAAPVEEDARLKLLRRASPDPGKSDVLVVGVDALLTQLARCCRPAPPDRILGYVTRGKGISIHRIGCANLSAIARQQPERLIETSWGEAGERLYPVDLVVFANDRQSLLRDISEVFSREKINVIGVNTQSQQNIAKMQFTVEVRSAAQLHKALSLLMDVTGVFEARRR
ncbi:MAG: RelA/SpoT family protein [Burkholderiaceae bacterium]|jgi:GTP pyrophosphokinase